jgi:hypothetical protein
MIIGIDSDCVLCAGVGDAAYRARATGRLAGGRDGDGPTDDEKYAKYGIQPGVHNPNYMSTSVRNRFPFLWIDPIFARSELASKGFIDRSIDAVFIDACHSEESVRNDILCWLPKIKEGGVVFGDDWAWESVKRGVAVRSPCRGMDLPQLLEYFSARLEGIPRDPGPLGAVKD